MPNFNPPSTHPSWDSDRPTLTAREARYILNKTSVCTHISPLPRAVSPTPQSFRSPFQSVWSDFASAVVLVNMTMYRVEPAGDDDTNTL